jgi:hypothetical protein
MFMLSPARGMRGPGAWRRQWHLHRRADDQVADRRSTRIGVERRRMAMVEDPSPQPRHLKQARLPAIALALTQDLALPPRSRSPSRPYPYPCPCSRRGELQVDCSAGRCGTSSLCPLHLFGSGGLPCALTGRVSDAAAACIYAICSMQHGVRGTRHAACSTHQTACCMHYSSYVAWCLRPAW